MGDLPPNAFWGGVLGCLASHPAVTVLSAHQDLQLEIAGFPKGTYANDAALRVSVWSTQPPASSGVLNRGASRTLHLPNPASRCHSPLCSGSWCSPSRRTITAASWLSARTRLPSP